MLVTVPICLIITYLVISFINKYAMDDSWSTRGKKLRLVRWQQIILYSMACVPVLNCILIFSFIASCLICWHSWMMDLSPNKKLGKIIKWLNK